MKPISIRHRFSDLPLSVKVGLILIGVWVLYGFINYLIHRALIFPTFVALEKDEAKKDMARIVQAIEREVYHLDTICKDWAYWDDTYAFVENPEPGYILNNLNGASFENNHLNLIYYFDVNGKIKWGRLYDGARDGFMSLPDFPKGSFPRLQALGFQPDGKKDPSHLSVSGPLLTSNGILLLAARPILTSEARGPLRGTLIMGRFLHDPVLESIRQQTQLDFNVFPLPIDAAMVDEGIAAGRISAQQPYDILLEKGGRLIIFAIYPGFSGKPAFLIKTGIATKIINKGKSTFKFAIGSTIASILAILLVMLLIMNRAIVNPIVKLTRHISHVIHTGNLSFRFENSRADEIGALTRQYNRMLADLDDKTTELEKIAISDGLTGLFNRRHILERLTREIATAKRYEHHLSILMLDIDHFKGINDSYGHPVGDAVLAEVATKIRTSLRDSDLVGRYGGEEFLVIFPYQDPGGAMNASERVRRNIESMSWPYDGMRVTISGGICTLTNENVSELIKRADKNLYRAKENGRNRIIGNGPETAP